MVTAQPVKLSDQLINAARESAELAHRSLAAQVEHWSTLGRAIEGTLNADQTAQLKRAVRESPPANYALSNAELASAVTQSIAQALAPESREKFRRELARPAQPIYGTDDAFSGNARAPQRGWFANAWELVGSEVCGAGGFQAPTRCCYRVEASVAWTRPCMNAASVARFQRAF